MYLTALHYFNNFETLTHNVIHSLWLTLMLTTPSIVALQFTSAQRRNHFKTKK